MTKAKSRQNAAKFFFALGHQRRLRIIDVLTDHPNGLSFEKLESEALILGASLSHHLRFLKDAGIIQRKIKDRYSIYRLNTAYLEMMLRSGCDRPRAVAA